MPRRNRPTQQRRAAYSFETDEDETNMTWDALARELVRRGLATRAILEPSKTFTRPNE